MSETNPGNFNDFTEAAKLDPASPDAVDAYSRALGDHYRELHSGDPMPVLSIVGAQVISLPVREVA